MAAVISLRPETERGVETLDELEKRTEMKPIEVIDDKTRRYYLEAEDASVDAFDPMLDQIDRDWRQHVTNRTDQLESEPDEELDQEELDEAWEEAGGD